MNIRHKGVKLMHCEECADPYMMVGDSPIRLARPPRRMPQIVRTGLFKNVGKCPKHTGGARA